MKWVRRAGIIDCKSANQCTLSKERRGPFEGIPWIYSWNWLFAGNREHISLTFFNITSYAEAKVSAELADGGPPYQRFCL